jgi:CubicO group peptidase (beta-lactamase class C family)
VRHVATLAAAFLLVVCLSVPALAEEHVPGATWMRYTDVGEAGFDPAKLEAARKTWESLPSSAFMVVADGAVVAAWGDVSRRFMCHSVRKSFLSALYGIYWDRGEIDLDKTLFDLGIDDTPDPLLDSERQARILDLLKARSGIFHPAAYAGRTDSAPRGSKGAGRYFAYNNWDFNTLATILLEETGEDVFEAFDKYFGQPLGMEDWRVTDGYYHLERDKSRYPAYPFRMSARDAARFGLLFAREGLWDDQRILSKHWVRRSSALYSIDDEIRGYGFLWWIYREPRFERHDMYAALGVGNQMIAVLPESDLVIVNRADTYAGEGTPDAELRDLVAQILDARVGEPVPEPSLAVLEVGESESATTVDVERLQAFRGRWDYPPAPLGQEKRTWVRLDLGDGYLVSYSPVSGTFRLFLQPDGSFREEDSHEVYYPIYGADGAFGGIADAGTVVTAAVVAMASGRSERGAELLALVREDQGLAAGVGRAVVELFEGKSEQAEKAMRALIDEHGARAVEGTLNFGGYQLLGGGVAEAARDVFALNTRLFPESANAWDSLGEAHIKLEAYAEAIRCYETSLRYNADNKNATAMIAKMRQEAAARAE